MEIYNAMNKIMLAINEERKREKPNYIENVSHKGLKLDLKIYQDALIRLHNDLILGMDEATRKGKKFYMINNNIEITNKGEDYIDELLELNRCNKTKESN